MMFALFILLLKTIYFFSLLFIFILLLVLYADQYTIAEAEDNTFEIEEDFLEEEIEDTELVWNELYELDLAVEVENIEDKPDPGDWHEALTVFDDGGAKQPNRVVDDFVGLKDNKSFLNESYFDINRFYKLFFNNEGLLLGVFMVVYFTLLYLQLFLILGLIFYLALFFYFNGYFTVKKFSNINLNLNRTKGYMNHEYSDEAEQPILETTEFIGSQDHVNLIQDTDNQFFNDNYYLQDLSMTDLGLYNATKQPFNYLVPFIDSKESVKLTLNENSTNFIIYKHITDEWRKSLSKLATAENSEKIENPIVVKELKAIFQYQDNFNRDLEPYLPINQYFQLYTTKSIFEFESFSTLNIFDVDYNLIEYLITELRAKFEEYIPPAQLFLPDGSKPVSATNSFYSCLYDESFLPLFKFLEQLFNLDNEQLYKHYLVENKTFFDPEPLFLEIGKYKPYSKPAFYIDDFSNLDEFDKFYISNANQYYVTDLNLFSSVVMAGLPSSNMSRIPEYKLKTLWDELILSKLTNFNLIKSNLRFRVEFERILASPFNNKFYLYLLNIGDQLKLNWFYFLFQHPVASEVKSVLNQHITVDYSFLKKSKFFKLVFKKLCKFDFKLILKKKSKNKNFLSNKKFLYYFWSKIINQMKQTSLPVSNLQSFDYLLSDEQFLNFISETILTKNKENLIKLNTILLIFLDPTIFYKRSANDFNFYYYNIINNENYLNLTKSQFLNFQSWERFFNSLNLTKLKSFLNLSDSIIPSNFVTNNNLNPENNFFLLYLNAVDQNNLMVDNLFFLKRFYKLAFFENSYFKFNEVNFIEEYHYVEKIFLLLFKFEFKNFLNFVYYNSFFKFKFDFVNLTNKRLNHVENLPLNGENNFLKFFSLYIEDHFMVDNFYKAVLNNLIFKAKPKLNVGEIELTQLNFFSDHPLNDESVSSISFIWVDNEDDILSFLPEDDILYESDSLDDDEEEDADHEIGLIQNINDEEEFDAYYLEDGAFIQFPAVDYGYFSFFPYKNKEVQERFIFFNLVKEPVIFKELRLYIPYHPNWFWLLLNFLKLILKTFFSLFPYYKLYSVIAIIVFVIFLFLI